MWLFFFFKQKTAYEMRISDWSSDVCSSDLGGKLRGAVGGDEAVLEQVVLGRRVELDRAAGAVVVGDHQALGRNEARGAAAQRYHGVHRRLRQVGQRGGVALVAGGRSEERRVGNECGSTGRSRWSPETLKK